MPTVTVDNELELYAMTETDGSWYAITTTELTVDLDLYLTNPTTRVNHPDWQGALDGGTAYAEGDIVSHVAYIYRANQACAAGENPSTHPLQWNKLCSDVGGWIPIGNITTVYSGTFDGGGYSISNLYLNRAEVNQGFFGYAFGAPINNVHLVDVDITATDKVGGLAGYNRDPAGSITNCSVTGSVTGNEYVGGLIGHNYNSTITGSYSTATVTGTGTSARVGGLVGGNTNSGSLTLCYATATVVGVGDRIGGLVGYNYSSASIDRCYTTGSVTVTGAGHDQVGGLVGYNNATSTVTDCYSTAAVNGAAADGVGGLVGKNSADSSVVTSHASGAVTGSTNVGGLVGEDLGTVTTSYYNSTTSGQSDTGKGSPLTTAEFADHTNFVGFGLDAWVMGMSMPKLSIDYPDAANLLNTDTVDGTAGTLTLPTAANVLMGSGAYGSGGTSHTPAYSPDFPDAANVINDDTVNGADGEYVPANANYYKSGETFGAAAEHVGTYVESPIAVSELEANSIDALLTQWGESVTYTKADDTVRVITAVVDYEPVATAAGNHGKGPKITVLIRNNTTSGISSGEITKGVDTITITEPDDTARARVIREILSVDDEAVEVVVR